MFKFQLKFQTEKIFKRFVFKFEANFQILVNYNYLVEIYFFLKVKFFYLEMFEANDNKSVTCDFRSDIFLNSP